MNDKQDRLNAFSLYREDIWISSVGYKQQERSFYFSLVDVSAGRETFVSLRWGPKVVPRLDERKSGLLKTTWIPLVYRAASGSTRFPSLSFLMEKSGIDLFCLVHKLYVFFLSFLGANCILIYFVIRLCPASYQSSLLFPSSFKIQYFINTGNCRFRKLVPVKKTVQDVREPKVGSAMM